MPGCDESELRGIYEVWCSHDMPEHFDAELDRQYGFLADQFMEAINASGLPFDNAPITSAGVQPSQPSSAVINPNTETLAAPDVTPLSSSTEIGTEIDSNGKGKGKGVGESAGYMVDWAEVALAEEVYGYDTSKGKGKGGGGNK